ncbi:Guanine nucleotide exchange factor lte1 [Myotisia sp. PD_48]|nr:Guanine nucleotide exchange factor lte1 [Myotisia sp. PD_48]
MDRSTNPPPALNNITDPLGSAREPVREQRRIPSQESEEPTPQYDRVFALRRAHSIARSHNISGEASSPHIHGLKSDPVRKVDKGNDGMENVSSLQRSNTALPSSNYRRGNVGIQEGRQFTVGKVGHNGKIYLRPIANQTHPRRYQPQRHSPATVTNPQTLAPPDHPRHSVWSSSQFSGLMEEIYEEEAHGIQHRSLRRRHSLSTIEDQPRVLGATKPGELRIVIERPAAVPQATADNTHPMLKISIPHYRLGKFKFSGEGTPALRSSAYTRTSVSDNFRSSIFTRPGDGIPNFPMEFMRDQAVPLAGSTTSGRATSQSQSTTYYPLKEPITPSIFDDLTPIIDDPSVVRYNRVTKQLSAATPARIVAQISSDCFMDYELVSDFFLTFRSYLSPTGLLSLLLARLEWAINRLKDDGRIIRIRVFAALRHWILNYFVDDFVANTDLRIQFCDRVNRLYKDLKPRRTDNSSDIKIIIDLKKCWNGRCSLHWDDPEFFGGSHPDDLIVPGGAGGENQTGVEAGLCLSYSEPLAAIDAAVKKEGVASSKEPHLPRTSPAFLHFRGRQASVPANVHAPSSSKGFLSNPCFPHPRLPKRTTGSTSSRSRNQHSVQVAIPELPDPTAPTPTSPTPISPIWRRPFHSHKRSGSFSDSARDDRAPLPHSNVEIHGQSFVHSFPQTASIIRGSMILPVEPDIASICPPSPTLEPLRNKLGPPGSPIQGDNPPKSPTPVKNLIGSIRRALQNKPASYQQENRLPSPPGQQGKTSLLPSNIVFGSERYRGSRPGTKNSGRIDVLCDLAFQSYQDLVAQGSDQFGLSGTIAGTGMKASAENIEPTLLDTEYRFPRGVYPERLSSQMTTGSKSIVIVDDTGTGFSILPEELKMYYPHHVSTLEEANIDPLTVLPLRCHRSSANGIQATGVVPEQYGTLMERSASAATPELRITAGPLNRLRKYSSYQSVLGKRDSDLVTMNMDPYRSSYQAPIDKRQQGMLRRRPGGNLRTMQNANTGDEPPTLTFISGTTKTESTSSALYISRASAMMGSISQITDVEPSSITTSQQYSFLHASSLPHGRHSYGDFVAGFSKIPDEGDGGIEATLLKLEGKWQKQSPELTEGGELHDSDRYHDTSELDRVNVYHERPLLDEIQAFQLQSESIVQPALSYPESFAGSEGSYCSIPLLERGLHDESMSTPKSRLLHGKEQHQFSNPNQISSNFENKSSSHPSIEIIEKTASLNRVVRGPTATDTHDDAPTSAGGDREEIKDNISDLSTEISMDENDTFLAHGGTKSSPLGVPIHPLSPTRNQHFHSSQPSSPALTAASLQYPQTPLASPTKKQPSRPNSKPRNDGTGAGPNTSPRTLSTITPLSNASHVPFILAYESLALAQQFTIVEQAALSEVDWKDLVDMKWSHSSQSTLNWVTYLENAEQKGIDLVVARFNLMVKWAVSEIVLTKNIRERVKVVIKLIHVAAHSRKIGNYATMLQIAIALSSVDCSRLTKTWERVPGAEKELLRELESLIQPIRNFHKLRLEMESSIQDGCIPFVGPYVQDLTYNSQKPAQLPGTLDGEPLVNFERYRTAATIVKSLLRLIDASTKYEFEPTPGIIERCLWIAALSDEDIRSLGNSLE